MHFSLEQLLTAGTVIVSVAIAYGRITTEIGAIKKLLGNGDDGVFIRRKEADIHRINMEEHIEDIKTKIGALEIRVMDAVINGSTHD